MRSSLFPLRSLALFILALALPPACASDDADGTQAAERPECAPAEEPVRGARPARSTARDGSDDRAPATPELALPSACVHRANTPTNPGAPDKGTTRIPAEWPEVREWMERDQQSIP